MTGFVQHGHFRASKASLITGSPSTPHSRLPVAGGGWRVEWTAADGHVSSEPLVGWAIKDDGFVPLFTDVNGDVEELSVIGRRRIYHPDQVGFSP
jgi:hypothetical protein